MKNTVSIECKACNATGLYVGMAERNGSAVVCTRCKGTGKDTIEFVPFVGRKPNPKVTRVHVTRGYVLSPLIPGIGGLPIEEWQPGAIIPADETLYCPFLYTNQKYCARRDDKGNTPVGFGSNISSCRYWDHKATCWAKFHEEDDRGEIT
jgi:hypothetical protein